MAQWTIVHKHLGHKFFSVGRMYINVFMVFHTFVVAVSPFWTILALFWQGDHSVTEEHDWDEYEMWYVKININTHLEQDIFIVPFPVLQKLSQYYCVYLISLRKISFSSQNTFEMWWKCYCGVVVFHLKMPNITEFSCDVCISTFRQIK